MFYFSTVIVQNLLTKMFPIQIKLIVHTFSLKNGLIIDYLKGWSCNRLGRVATSYRK